jgi:hypothetical protein
VSILEQTTLQFVGIVSKASNTRFNVGVKSLHSRGRDRRHAHVLACWHDGGPCCVQRIQVASSLGIVRCRFVKVEWSGKNVQIRRDLPDGSELIKALSVWQQVMHHDARTSQ